MPFSYVKPIPVEHENAPGTHIRAEQSTPVLNRSLAGPQPSMDEPEGLCCLCA